MCNIFYRISFFLHLKHAEINNKENTINPNIQNMIPTKISFCIWITYSCIILLYANKFMQIMSCICLLNNSLLHISFTIALHYDLLTSNIFLVLHWNKNILVYHDLTLHEISTRKLLIYFNDSQTLNSPSNIMNVTFVSKSFSIRWMKM